MSEKNLIEQKIEVAKRAQKIVEKIEHVKDQLNKTGYLHNAIIRNGEKDRWLRLEGGGYGAYVPYDNELRDSLEKALEERLRELSDELNRTILIAK